MYGYQHLHRNLYLGIRFQEDFRIYGFEVRLMFISVHYECNQMLVE